MGAFWVCLSGGKAMKRSQADRPTFSPKVMQTLAMWTAISRNARVSSPCGLNSNPSSGIASTFFCTVPQIRLNAGCTASRTPITGSPHPTCSSTSSGMSKFAYTCWTSS